MSTDLAARPTGAADTSGRPAVRPTRAGLARSYRFELVKLLSQWRIRLLAVVCWVAPAVFVAAVSNQDSLPVDTLFGRWMHATGWAGALVTLGFAGTWALPLVTSVVAGDVFAAEDRLGTWPHLLVTVRSPRRIFAAKALASASVLVVLVVGLAVSSSLAGVLVVGNHPLVGLDGHSLSPAHAAVTVALAWLCVLAPTLALAAIGLLGSVLLGRSPMGLLLPAVVALALQLLQMLPLPVAVRLALPGYTFIAWNGLFANPAQLRPLLIGVVVSLVWAVAITLLAYRLFVGRDFTNASGDVPGRRALALGLVPLVALVAVGAVVLTPVASASGTGITRAKVQDSLAIAWAHLYRLQTRELHRPAVTEAQLRATAACTKGDGLAAPSGPGNDWRCVVSWHLPGTDAVGQAVYQLDVHADGRYVADGDGPKDVNGYYQLKTDTGDAPNPLWQFDGNVDLLSTSKG